MRFSSQLNLDAEASSLREDSMHFYCNWSSSPLSSCF
jgi:hypothetical protein